MSRHAHRYIFVILLLMMTSLCHAQYIDNIDLLPLQDYKNNKTQVTASYSILVDTTFTENIDTYNYGKYQLKLVNVENPHKMIFEITENTKFLLSNNENIKLKTPYPWWSTRALKEIKHLDFSMVDGQKDVYTIGENYRLSLLSRQGHWGKVYVLERLTPGSSDVEIISAVKLLLSRSDRDMDVNTFRDRHQIEIHSNIILDDLSIALAIKPYGIVRNDDDHYLLFMEYGENAQSYFKKQSLDTIMEPLYAFMDKVD